MRSRMLGATIATAAAASITTACTNEDPEATATLPTIITTTSTSTTVPPLPTIPRFYEVQPGDTLTAIAEEYGIPIKAIMVANAITDQNSIQAGQLLQLPTPDIVAETRPDRGAAPSTSSP